MATKPVEQLECIQGGDECVIDSKSWKSCKRCRFQKCLEAGMKSSWVLSEPERRSRNAVREKARRTREKKMGETRSGGVPVVVDAAAKMISQRFTPDESAWLLSLYRKGFDHNYKIVANFYKKHLDVLETALVSWKTGVEFPSEKYKIVKEKLLRPRSGFFVEFYHAEMSGLAPGDLQALEDANYDLVINFFQASMFNCREEFLKHFIALEKMLARVGDFQALVEKLADLNLNDTEGLGSRSSVFTYEQLYPPAWALTKDLEKRHKELTLRCGNWVKCKGEGQSSSEEALGNDVQLIMLMLQVLMFSADGVELRDPRTVDGIQTKYSYMLYRYLNDTYPKSVVTSKYCQAMYLRSALQEAHSIQSKGI